MITSQNGIPHGFAGGAYINLGNLLMALRELSPLDTNPHDAKEVVRCGILMSKSKTKLMGTLTGFEKEENREYFLVDSDGNVIGELK